MINPAPNERACISLRVSAEVGSSSNRAECYCFHRVRAMYVEILILDITYEPCITHVSGGKACSDCTLLIIRSNDSNREMSVMNGFVVVGPSKMEKIVSQTEKTVASNT